MPNPELPPLPEPDVYLIVADNGKYAEAGGDYGDPYFDADQVRTYAAELGAENGRLRAALREILEVAEARTCGGAFTPNADALSRFAAARKALGA